MRILRPLQAGVERCLIRKSFDQNIEVHLEPKKVFLASIP